MKVRITKAFSCHMVGDVVEVDQKLADRYCESGRAELVGSLPNEAAATVCDPEPDCDEPGPGPESDPVESVDEDTTETPTETE